MPASLPAFTSEPPAKMAQSLVAMWPLISSKIRWVASTEKANSQSARSRERGISETRAVTQTFDGYGQKAAGEALTVK